MKNYLNINVDRQLQNSCNMCILRESQTTRHRSSPFQGHKNAQNVRNQGVYKEYKI